MRNNHELVPVRNHAGFSALFEEFETYIETEQPRSGAVEEVIDFTAVGKEEVEAWVDQLLKMLHKHGYSTTTETLDNETWLGTTRLRPDVQVYY